MRAALLSALVALSAAIPSAAQDKAKPNTLTPKEIADGWILLFDGETTFGWRSGRLKSLEPSGSDSKFAVAAESLRLPRFPNYAACSTCFRFFDVHMDYVSAADWTKSSDAWLAIDRFNIHLRSNLAEPRFRPFTMQFGQAHVHYRRDVDNWQHGVPPDYASAVIWANSGSGDEAKLLLQNIKLRPEDMKPLFNGKDLTGWHVFPGKKSQFTVEDGCIVCKNGPGDLQTDGKYANFILQLECKVNGKHLNSGVFFRCKANEYQNGYEAQIHNDFTADPPKTYTVEEYDPKTHKLLKKEKVTSAAKDFGTGAIYRRVPARKSVAKDGEWFTMTIVAEGNHIAIWVNGVQQVDWYDNRPASDNPRTGCRLEAGHISFQGHDSTTNLSFRNIRIAELPSKGK